MKKKNIKMIVGILVGLAIFTGAAAGGISGPDDVEKVYATSVTDDGAAADNTDNGAAADNTDDGAAEADDEEESDGLTIENGVLKYVEDDVKNVVLPDTVKAIGHGAIGEYVQSIEISASVTKIDKQAFANAASLKKITVAKGNTKFSAYKNCLYDKKKKTLLAVPPKSSKVSIYSKTKVIGSYAFNHCNKLKSVVLPKGVTTIKAYAFYYCDKLRKVTIYSKAKSISVKSFIGDDVSYNVYYTTDGTSKTSKNTLKIYCKKGSKADKVAKKAKILTKYL
ncbi:MAG: leucine-rich repeat domain-containing protein [Lachnospiraceae bacterium]|nr:leucine-rich repeat domain-containing protein [Lachnospiraceae bacterium]